VPGAVLPGASCSTPPALKCQTTAVKTTCQDVYIACTCAAGAWSCDDPCPDASGGSCPPPGKVNVGIACMAPGLVCPGNPEPCGQETFFDVFQCLSGSWTRTVATACDVDGG
jgi:hypothetical protein